MPRFVILRHDLPATAPRPSHWDLMFETGAKLRTWAIGVEPDLSVDAHAEPLANHRLEYLEYEGPVSGDRGTVTRWDAGQYELIEDVEDRWVVSVHGQRLTGRIAIVRQAGDAYSWRVRFGAAPSEG
jgi:hypothetical protein